MSDSMDFPNAWRKFLQEYSFKDKEQIYTNGSELIPVFRVEQMVEQYLVEKQTCEYWYQGYYKLLGELANYKWISVKDRLPEPKKDVLVYSEIEHPHKIRVDFLKASGQWFNSFHVTHWMSLPQPPEKENEE